MSALIIYTETRFSYDSDKEIFSIVKWDGFRGERQITTLSREEFEVLNKFGEDKRRYGRAHKKGPYWQQSTTSNGIIRWFPEKDEFEIKRQDDEKMELIRLHRHELDFLMCTTNIMKECESLNLLRNSTDFDFLYKKYPNNIKWHILEERNDEEAIDEKIDDLHL